ncbi:RNA pseudouridylate synthase family protein [Brugia pahangi]
MDEKDDFFGIREATETSLPRHMEAAIMLRSRTMGKNRREDSNKQNVVSDQRLAEQHPDGSSNDLVEDSNEDGDNDDDRIVQSVEALDLKTYNDMGIKKIWEEIEPVWKMNNDDLINIMTNRIIYEDEELIAFDKPYQVACSNAPSNQAELLRILPQLSSRITPHMNCLRIVKSIGKSVTGVTLFAKNQNVQEKIKTLYENGLVEQCYRVITNMAPAHQEATINIPLVKCRRKNNNYVMLPLSANSSNEITPFLEASTYYRVLRHDPKNHTSYMECVVNCDVPEQIRAHLGIGIACPIIGDIKYNYSRREAGRGIPPRLSDSALQDLNIAGNSFRRLPMYIHLKEVIIPLSKQSSNKIHICAPIPSFFTYTLRKLRLLKK